MCRITILTPFCATPTSPVSRGACTRCLGDAMSFGTCQMTLPVGIGSVVNAGPFFSGVQKKCLCETLRVVARQKPTLACDNPGVDWLGVLTASIEARVGHAIPIRLHFLSIKRSQCVLRDECGQRWPPFTSMCRPWLLFRSQPSHRYPHRSSAALMAYATLVSKGLLSANNTGFYGKSFDIQTSPP